MNDKQIKNKLKENAKKDRLAQQILVDILAGTYSTQEGWEIYKRMTINKGDID